MTIVVKKVPKCLRGIVKLLFRIKDYLNKKRKIAHKLKRSAIFLLEESKL